MRWLIAALLGLAVSAAAATTVTDGIRAFERGDFQTARTLLQPWADAGNRDAQATLGRMFANGDGVLQDYVSAHKWFNLAAASGHAEARALRETIANRMTPAQLAEAQASARAFVPRPLPASGATAASQPAAAPTPAPAAAPAPVTRATVRDIQRFLGELGYDAGPADGLMGRRTRSAIRAWQGHSGLPADGKPSVAMRDALAEELGRGTTATASAGSAASPVRTAPPPAPTPNTAGNAVTRDIQSYLTELGYDPGPADGSLGNRTRAAIRAYQSHSDLPVDGLPSVALRDALAVDLGYADPAPIGGAASTPVAASTSGSPAVAASSGSSGSSQPVYVREAEAAASGSGSYATTDARDSGRDPARRLRRIIRRAENRGEADPEVFARLDALLGTRRERGFSTVFVDDFADGNFTQSPKWTVIAGDFWIAPGEGLRTRVQPRAAQFGQTSGATSGKDVGLALLGAILSQGSQSRTTAPTAATAPTATPAGIYAAARTGAPFRMAMRVASGETSGHLEVGPFKRDPGNGFRIVYMGTRQRNLQLVRFVNGNESVLDFNAGPFNLEDGRFHDLVISRDVRGRLSVALDGQVVLQAVDRAFEGGFDGFILQNRGGNYALSRLEIGS